MTTFSETGFCTGNQSPEIVSDKIYAEGSIFPLKVGMRLIALSKTYTVQGREFSSFPIYDTSGPYSDPALVTEPRKGLLPIRDTWGFNDGKTSPSEESSLPTTIPARKPLKAQEGVGITQMHYARNGVITPEMEYVAIRENQMLESWTSSFRGS
ncbi:MAG: phosphomethylpyrimidine synthase, partial [Chlorobiaceae bacterium]|nr:phosphomethylpyrimidine synthase [Chlorobiaceae bacterium]